MADTIEKAVDSGKTFFDISFNTDQIGMEFEQIPRKMKATYPLHATFRQRYG